MPGPAPKPPPRLERVIPGAPQLVLFERQPSAVITNKLIVRRISIRAIRTNIAVLKLTGKYREGINKHLTNVSCLFQTGPFLFSSFLC